MRLVIAADLRTLPRETNMQPFNFGIRQSSEDTFHDSYGRQHVASSIYSGGPGPAEEIPHTTSVYSQDNLRNPFQGDLPRYNPLNKEHPQSSALLNINDPVAMHLLMETAMVDSKEYEILSFEEVEKLKRERSLLRNRVDAVQRKLALESKLRDAAQSLNRLYSTKGRPGSSGDTNESNSSQSPKRHRRSFLGSRGSNNDASSRADDEFVASNRRIEELAVELNRLEKRLEETQRRLLEHTSGILQMTHKGLKKNLRKTELPRSPESMASINNRSTAAHDGVDDFDERSFYQIPDYMTDPGRADRSANGYASKADLQALQDTEKRLAELSGRLHTMILQVDPEEPVDLPPASALTAAVSRPGNQIQAHLGYMASGLEAMEAAQARTVQEAQKTILDSEDRLGELNLQLHHLLEKTDTIGQGPAVVLGESQGKSMQAQLEFSTMVLSRLHQRVEQLIAQKDILTRQIQQQRELNTKSDARRDAQIHDLTEELAEAVHLHTIGEQESQHSRDQITMLVEQLDLARQEATLHERQRGMDVDKALQTEKKVRREAEEVLLADIRSAQDQHANLKADFEKMHDDFEIREQQQTQSSNQLVKAKGDCEIELQRSRSETEELKKADIAREGELEKCRTEMQGLESEVVRLQTELTVARAELDGAYGTRAQRAADVSMNPAVQKEMDGLTENNTALRKKLDALQTQHETKVAGNAELQNKVNNLQKELKDTIEDYELMTKASIEFEKERDHLEATIDNVRERCESVETQLSDEKVKWLGATSSAPLDTISTMVLKNEFKKMMRDTRAENIKSLRAEQEERRRLESVIRSMKKEIQQQTPTKSTLTQSVMADS